MLYHIAHLELKGNYLFFYMATLEGERTIDKAIKNIINDEIDSLVIKPLFMIPGKHVISDSLFLCPALPVRPD